MEIRYAQTDFFLTLLGSYSMVFGLIAASVVALAAAAMWILTQQKLQATSKQAQEYESKSEASISKLNGQLSDVEGKLATSTSSAETLKSEKLRLVAEQKQTSSELTDLEAKAKASASEVSQMSEQLESLTDERDALAKKLADSEESTRVAKKQAALDALSGDAPIRAETLWDLELARSVRTWKTSVSTNPSTSVSPFDGVENPVRKAVEIDAAALREDVGASVTIDWKVGEISDPARCHLILRLAQEMMATAAREPEPTRLTVEGDGELSLRIEPDTESDESVITLSPPKITSDLLDISSERGLIITLKSQDVEAGTETQDGEPEDSDSSNDSDSDQVVSGTA